MEGSTPVSYTHLVGALRAGAFPDYCGPGGGSYAGLWNSLDYGDYSDFNFVVLVRDPVCADGEEHNKVKILSLIHI